MWRWRLVSSGTPRYFHIETCLNTSPVVVLLFLLVPQHDRELWQHIQNRL
jgi:hypothetical protein